MWSSRLTSSNVGHGRPAEPQFFFELELRLGLEGIKKKKYFIQLIWSLKNMNMLNWFGFGWFGLRQSGIYALSKTMTPNYVNVVYHALFNSLF